MKSLRITLIAAAIIMMIQLSVFAQKHSSKLLDGILAKDIETHLVFLASDALRGRQAGTNDANVAAKYIQAMLKLANVRPLEGQYFQCFQALSPPREKDLDFQVHKDSVSKYKQLQAYRKLDLKNVVGVIKGQHEDQFVILGAHYDHVGVDETLVGDQIYNGADDNAASVAAVLTIAKVLADSGQKPLRSIVFALWDGEEVNYLGSDYFAQNFEHIKQVKAYVNLDMIAKNGFVPILYPEFKLPDSITDDINATGNEFHFLYTNELESTAKQLTKDIADNKLDISPKLRIMEHKSRGSDYLPFSVQGVPVAWFFTGLHDQYHTPADEVQAVDLEKATSITKATLLLIDKLANE